MKRGPQRKYIDGESANERCHDLWMRGIFRCSWTRSILHDIIPGRRGFHGITAFGCYADDFVWHIERQFVAHPSRNVRMTWPNKYLWHIDHIVPIASFNHNDSESMRECWHWTNMRPLWAFDNMSKGAKLTVEFRVPFAVRQLWLPRETIIAPDGLVELAAPAAQECAA